MDDVPEDDADDDLLDDLLEDIASSGADWALCSGRVEGVDRDLGGEELGVKAGEAVLDVGGVLAVDPVGDLNGSCNDT